MNNAQISNILLNHSPSEVSLAYRGTMHMDTFLRECKERIQAWEPNLFIINTEMSTSKQLGHWLLVQIELKRVLFFDSYGKNPHYYSEEFNTLLHQVGTGVLEVAPFKIQSSSSKLCGMFCLFIAFNCIDERNVEELIKRYFSPEDFIRNEHFLMDWARSSSFSHLLRSACPISDSECIEYGRLM